ncbi:MAG: MotA/TolQ/ExbB proton channel family protein [bacterium]|nr:MotA/TolQ/ExbB proton channel family protein [bacterium]
MLTFFFSIAHIQTQQNVQLIDVANNNSAWNIFIQTIVQSVIHSGPVGKLILLILLFYSIVSWAIIFNRFFVIHRAKTRAVNFINAIWTRIGRLPEVTELEKVPDNPVVAVVRAAYHEIGPHLSVSNPLENESKLRNLDRVLTRVMQMQVAQLEKYLNFLGTTASACPYWGLLGTVWGILSAFYTMGSAGTASITTIGPSLAEALIATAAGLTAAIPALIAYNYFIGQIKFISRQMEQVGSEILSLVEKQ